MQFLKLKRNPFAGLDEVWAEAASNAEAAISQAAGDTGALLKDSIQSNARQAGWDDKIVSAVDVHRRGLTTFVGIADDGEAEEAFNREYGTHRTPPQPVMRSTTKQARPELDRFFKERLTHYLFEGD